MQITQQKLPRIVSKSLYEISIKPYVDIPGLWFQMTKPSAMPLYKLSNFTLKTFSEVLENLNNERKNNNRRRFEIQCGEAALRLSSSLGSQGDGKNLDAWCWEVPT